MSNDAVLTAVDALTAEPFFQVQHNRTFTRCVAWIDQALTGECSPVSLSDVVADSVAQVSDQRDCDCPRTHPCHGCIRATAATYLRMSTLVPANIEQVTDVPDACDLVHASRPTHLMDDDDLADRCDLAPGGAELFHRIGATGIRQALLEDGRLSRDLIGHDLLFDFFGRGVRPVYLRRANQVLLDLDGSLWAIKEAVRSDMDDDELVADAQFRGHLSSDAISTLPALLYLPFRHQAVRAVAALASTVRGAPMRSTLDRLVRVLDADACRTRPERALRDAVWLHLLEHSELPARDLPSQVNNDRMVDLFGFFPCNRTLRRYPQLRRCVEGTLRVGRDAGTTQPDDQDRPRPQDRAGRLTVAQALQVVLDFHADHDRLPRHSELDPALLTRVEDAVGIPLNEWCRRLARVRDLRAAGRSSNERRLDAVTGQVLQRVATMVSFEEEWSCPDTFDSHYRVDTRIVFTDDPSTPAIDASGEPPERFELYLEADGEGHFEQTGNWDLQSTLANDVAKATQLRTRILALRGDGRDGLLLMAHHAVLTKAARHRMHADHLIEVLRAARELRAWWVFVRPAGCDQMRARPDAPLVQLQLGDGLDHLEAFAIVR